MKLLRLESWLCGVRVKTARLALDRQLDPTMDQPDATHSFQSLNRAALPGLAANQAHP